MPRLRIWRMLVELSLAIIISRLSCLMWRTPAEGMVQDRRWIAGPGVQGERHSSNSSEWRQRRSRPS